MFIHDKSSFWDNLNIFLSQLCHLMGSMIDFIVGYFY
jgi:hypothetical protein